MRKTSEEELVELKEILGKQFPSFSKTVTRNLAASFFLSCFFLEPTGDGMEGSP